MHEAGEVDRAEWRWAWGWALVVVALSCAPYLYAYFAAPPGRTFGGFLINTQDGNSYLAKMRQGYDGAWLFRLPFTPEDQREENIPQAHVTAIQRIFHVRRQWYDRK